METPFTPFMDDFQDISTELVRRYIYTDGYVYTIREPQLLLVQRSIEGGHSHRIVSEVDGQRVSHYVRPGWVALEWEKRDRSCPDFLF